MATLDQIQHLFSTLGPALQPLSVEGVPDERLWGVMLDEDLNVLIEFDEQRNMLVLECVTGSLPNGEPARHFEILLTYNYLWHQTGGTRFGLAGPDSKIVQILDVSADGVEPQELAEIIAGFGAEARAWRERLASTALETTDVAEPVLAAEALDMIRG